MKKVSSFKILIFPKIEPYFGLFCCRWGLRRFGCFPVVFLVRAGIENMKCLRCRRLLGRRRRLRFFLLRVRPLVTLVITRIPPDSATDNIYLIYFKSKKQYHVKL